MQSAHGKYVTGDEFWDRQDDLALFESKIREGANQTLVAQRRMGKTSLMHETARRLQDEYFCIFVDLQKSESAADAIAAIGAQTGQHRGIWNWTKKVFANALGNLKEIKIHELEIKLRADMDEGTWRNKADQLMEGLAHAEKQVLLLLDEVPILVNRMLKGPDFDITPERRDRTDLFLSWLRDSSSRYQGRIMMVLSGSIGLEPVLRQARLSATLNTFAPFELGPWDDETAIGLIVKLAKSYQLELADGVAEEMVGLLGCNIPHHVQMFFDLVHDTARRRKDMRVTVEMIDPIYREKMLSVRGHVELTSYEERLELVLSGSALALAFDMLTEAAVVGVLTAQALDLLGRDHQVEGESTARLRDELLWVLEHDGYLKPRADGYGFVSHLVRDWWKARHSLTYIPAAKRKR